MTFSGFPSTNCGADIEPSNQPRPRHRRWRSNSYQPHYLRLSVAVEFRHDFLSRRSIHGWGFLCHFIKGSTIKLTMYCRDSPDLASSMRAVHPDCATGKLVVRRSLWRSGAGNVCPALRAKVLAGRYGKPRLSSCISCFCFGVKYRISR